MTGAMNLFRRRGMRTPTPYKSDRIAFLNPNFCAIWCANYNIFSHDPKKYMFDEYFRKLYLGEVPLNCPSFKKWFKDVDTLYVAHNIDNIHKVEL